MNINLDEKEKFLKCDECIFLSFEMHKRGDLKDSLDFQCLKTRKFLLIERENYQIGKSCLYKK